MRCAGLALVLLSAAAVGQDASVPDAPGGGDAQSALEARIVEFNPCEPLGAEIAGMTLGLGHVRSVQVRNADLNLQGDGVSLQANGRLVCRGANADAGSDLATDISVTVEGILSGCRVTETDVTLSNTEGEMAWALELVTPVIQGLLISRIQEAAAEFCSDFAQ